MVWPCLLAGFNAGRHPHGAIWRPRRDLNPCYRRERAAVYGKLLKLRDTDGFRKQFQ